MDGIDICLNLKNEPSLKDTQYIFYTDRNDDYSQIAAYNAGADDYIVKPVAQKILLSRIRALLKRHAKKEKEGNHASGKALIIDRDRYLILKCGNEIILPRKEFELLALLLSAPKKVFSRKEIAEHIWGYEMISSNRTIDVHVRRLREKIGGEHIKTLKGIGYSATV